MDEPLSYLQQLRIVGEGGLGYLLEVGRDKTTVNTIPPSREIVVPRTEINPIHEGYGYWDYEAVGELIQRCYEAWDVWRKEGQWQIKRYR